MRLWRVFQILQLQILICFFAVSCKSSSFSGQSKPAPASTPTPGPTSVPPSSQPYTPPGPTYAPAPAPPGAVTKGSFTAWAMPPNPAKGQDYQIFISVQLPAGIPNYSLYDLTGRVQGTDMYTQNIQQSIQSGVPIPMPAQFQWNGTQALISLWVPGAESKVRDDIYITSALLHES